MLNKAEVQILQKYIGLQRRVSKSNKKSALLVDFKMIVCITFIKYNQPGSSLFFWMPIKSDKLCAFYNGKIFGLFYPKFFCENS